MDLWQSLQIILWFGHVVCFPPIWSRSKKQTTTKRTEWKMWTTWEKKWSHICMCEFVSGTWCALFMLWGRNVIYINLWLKCRKCFNQTFINYKICMCRWIYADGFWSLQRDNTKNSDVLQKSECVSSMTSFSKWFVVFALIFAPTISSNLKEFMTLCYCYCYCHCYSAYFYETRATTLIFYGKMSSSIFCCVLIFIQFLQVYSIDNPITWCQ